MNFAQSFWIDLVADGNDVTLIKKGKIYKDNLSIRLLIIKTMLKTK